MKNKRNMTWDDHVDKVISIAILSPFVVLMFQYLIMFYFNVGSSGLGSIIQIISKVIVGLFYLSALKYVLRTFMDAIPAMILFVPVILPTSTLFGIDPVHLGLIVVITLAVGLVTPPYGLCLLLAAKIGDLSIERSFLAVLPYIGIILIVLFFLAFFPEIAFYVPKLLNPQLF